MESKTMKTFISTSGFILSLSFFLLLSPGQGLRCYECTNDDEGCFIEGETWHPKGTPQQIPDKYIVECAPGAVSCIHFEAYYDYLFGDFLHRSCLYKSDKKPLGVNNGPDISGFGSTTWSWNYPEGIAKWIRSRTENSLPPPVLAKRKLPQQMTPKRVYKHFVADLSNNFYPIYMSFIKGRDEPKPMDVSCFTCDVKVNEVKISTFQFWKKGIDPVHLPDCAGRSVQCKGAYGCAAFWERRQEYDYKVWRVWRDCWYPGEMKCLRNPEGVGRSLSKGKDGESCKKKFKERSSRQGSDPIVWDGLHTLETLKEYLAFLECVREIRARTGKEFNWSIKQLSDIKDPPQNETGEIFSQVRYYFCSPSDHCARGYEEPPSTTTPQPTTTTEAVTSTRTTVSVKPTTRVNPTGGGGSDGDLVEIWEDCNDEGKNGGVVLCNGANLVPGLIFSSLVHLKLIL